MAEEKGKRNEGGILPELLTSEDVAAVLGTSVKQVHNMKGRGQLPAPKRIPGLGLRWTKLQLVAWLAELDERERKVKQ